MEEMGVIRRVKEPTEWCAGIVVVSKKNSQRLRLCVDYTGLNQYVCREKYVLPSVDQSLGMLAGASVFSKLDANMGFWQIPLAEESAKYTTFITPFGRLPASSVWHQLCTRTLPACHGRGHRRTEGSGLPHRRPVGVGERSRGA